MTSQMPSDHPIRVLLTHAIHGDITVDDLDKLIDAHDQNLPPGQGLSRYRQQLTRDAVDVRKIGATGDYGSARRAVDNITHGYAERMTPAQIAIHGDANPESLETITARMFGGRR